MRRSRLVTLALSLAAALGATFAAAAPARRRRHRSLRRARRLVLLRGRRRHYTAESGSCHAAPTPTRALERHSARVLRSVACSGATTTDVMNSQLSALSSSTTLVSITVGGNDVGFSNIMTTCVLYGKTAASRRCTPPRQGPHPTARPARQRLQRHQGPLAPARVVVSTTRSSTSSARSASG